MYICAHARARRPPGSIAHGGRPRAGDFPFLVRSERDERGEREKKNTAREYMRVCVCVCVTETREWSASVFGFCNAGIARARVYIYAVG